MSTTLGSWKEIASYLGKGVRTVQRWEKQFGLPVHRPSASSHVLFVVPAELDAWVKGQTQTDNLGQRARKTFRSRQRALLKQLQDHRSRLGTNRRMLSLEIVRMSNTVRNMARNGESTQRQEKASHANQPRAAA